MNGIQHDIILTQTIIHHSYTNINFTKFRNKILKIFSHPITRSYPKNMGLGHFDRGHLGRGHYGRGHLGRGHYGRGHFGRGHLGRGHFGPLI